jgi:imidazolonepropionase-like amidohydrolase
MRTMIAMLLTLAGAAATADEPAVTAIHSRHVLDVRTGTAGEAYVIVRGDHLAAIEKKAPAGAHVIELGEATVLPGLIDCHVHLEADWSDFSATGNLRRSSPAKTLTALQNAQTYLQRGFTTVRDAGTTDPAYDTIALREAIGRGAFTGPRILAAGVPISVTGGHGDLNALAPDVPMTRGANIADTVDEIRVAVRHDLRNGVDWVKLMATGGVVDSLSDYNVQELSEEQMRAAVEVAHRAGRKVMAHAEGTRGITAAVRAGIDSIEHGTMLDEETAQLMAERGTWLVPTLETFQRGVEIGLSLGQEPVMLEKGKAILRHQQPAFERAIRHQVKIAFGLDDEPKYSTREFQALVTGGLTPLQALQAATTNAALLLGVDAGSLEPGRLADVIAVDGDPLHDIKSLERVVFVMKGGQVVRDVSESSLLPKMAGKSASGRP